MDLHATQDPAKPERVQERPRFAHGDVGHLSEQTTKHCRCLLRARLPASEDECANSRPLESQPFKQPEADSLIPSEHYPSVFSGRLEPNLVGSTKRKRIAGMPSRCAFVANESDQDSRVDRLV
jgi:hypothetical protein